MRLPLRLLEQITGRKLDTKKVADHLEQVGFPIEEVIELLPKDPDIVTAQIAGKLKDDADGVILTAKTADKQYDVFSHTDVALESIVLIAFKKSPLAKKVNEVNKDVDAIVVVEKDLGLEDDTPVLLPQVTPLGAPMTEVLDSIVLDVEITPNRGDLYSIYGLARELSVLFGERFESPKQPTLDITPGKHPFKLEIEPEEDVTQYYGFVIGGIRVKSSPFWLRWRLHTLGSRSVNNVVDTTNYTMFLTGQPLHAFDASMIGGSVVKVRKAESKEAFTAIDHKEYKLSDDCLLIADKDHPIALAGVMGGLDSEVGESAIGLFLESAEFTSQSARRSITHTGLQSDSSKRFAAGVDGEMVRKAAVIFINTLLELCPDLEVKGELKYGKPVDKGSVKLDFSTLDAYAATEINKIEAKKDLELIGFEVNLNKDSMLVKVPSHRNDMTEDVDVIEEVLRLVGYDNLPSQFIVRTEHAGKRHPLSRDLEFIRNFFTGQGLNEIHSLSLISTEEIPQEFKDSIIPLTNPLSERLSVLRPTLLPGMLAAAAENIRFDNQGLALFEIGEVFKRRTKKLDESLHLGILVTGQATPLGWNENPRQADLFDLKGIVEMFFEKLSISDILYENSKGPEYLDARSLIVKIGTVETAGIMGKVSVDALRRLDISQEVFFCELSLAFLKSPAEKETLYESLSRFKAVERDIALLLDADHNAATVMQFVRQKAGDLCSDLEVFDSFAGSPLPKGKRNLGLRLKFQPKNRNLSKEELDDLMANLARDVAAKFNATVRGREGNGS